MKDEKISRTPAKLTAEMGDILAKEFKARDFHVFVGHTGETIGSSATTGLIRCWSGTEYAKDHELARLDIAVVSKNREAIALIEIEEGSATPKLLLGDFLATLAGDHISVERGITPQPLKVGTWTSLILFTVPTTAGERGVSSAQVQLVSELAKKIQASLNFSKNSIIGYIDVKLFTDKLDLGTKLRTEVERAISNWNEQRVE